MSLFSWMRKSNKDISCEYEVEYVIPTHVHEESRTMIKHHSLLNLFFLSLKAENKFSVYL